MERLKDRPWVFAFLALIAFAANSILCRLALGGHLADPVGFSAVRLVSGAFALILLSSGFKSDVSVIRSGNWLSSIWLFVYAISFSIAYLNLTTGTGALILFGSVQLTMMTVAVFKGERPHAAEWLGLVVAGGGLVYLVLPGLEAPPLQAAFLMMVAGIAWGLYTLRGRGAQMPLARTAGNFLLTIPLVLLLCIIYADHIRLSADGVLLATASGAIASGAGYAIWYAALRGLSATRASVVQLAVPVLAALGGVLFLSEQVSWRLGIAALMILGGITLALFAASPSYKS
jgi:drug/metabolite transporter (DMT)-like permease